MTSKGPEKRDFNKEAATWDSPPRVRVAEDISQAIRRSVSLNPDMDVLDFGCGTGLLSLALRPEVRSITGMDTSEGMLEVFNSKVTAQNIKGARTILIDPQKALVIPGKYHLIVSSMTLHHIKDLAALLKSFYEVLLPGGSIALADLDPDEGLFHDSADGIFHNGFEHGALTQELKSAGFEKVNFSEGAQVTKPVRDRGLLTFTIFLVSASRLK